MSEKIVIQHTIKINGFDDDSEPTLDSSIFAFEEQDRYLAHFIFKNFGHQGTLAIKRMYNRVRDFYVLPTDPK